MKSNILNFAATAGFCAFAASASAAPYSVAVEGNSRTQSSYIRNLVKHCVEKFESDQPGKPLQAGAEAIRQCVFNSKLFSEVKVAIRQRAIRISVADVWSIIPIPLAQAGSDDSSSLGLVLMDSNFLGYGMQLIVGGAKSNRGDMYGVVIKDPSLFFSKWSGSVGLLKMNQQILFKEDGEVIDGFYENLQGGLATLGYQMNRWTVTGTVIAGKADYDHYRDYAEINDATLARTSINIAYNAQNYRLYFSEGFAASWDVGRDASRSGGDEPLNSTMLNTNYQIGLFGDHALVLAASMAMVSNGSKADALRIGGANGTRGIEASTLWVRQIQYASADYQIPLWTGDSGTWTVAPFMDAGHAKPTAGKDDDISYFAVGVGSYFYLKEVAIPGVGFSVGYNNRFQSSFASVSLGLSL